MKKKLILLGNGFDVSCGLKSRYSDFLENLKNIKDLDNKKLNAYNSLYVKSEKGMYYDWKDIEERYKQLIQAVNTMDLDNNDIQKMKYISKLNEDLDNFSNDLKNYLNQEVKKYDFKKKESIFLNNLFKESEVDVICYNYTNIISEIKLSESKNIKVYNIHGSLDDDNIIVGHNINCDDNKTLVKGSQINNKEIRRDNDFSQEIEKEYDELHIIGCSIIGTDYDDIIEYMKKSNTIYIYDYKGDSVDKIEYIKNRQPINDDIIKKLKVIIYPEIFINKNEILEEKQIKFLKRVFNINMIEIEGVIVPRTLEYFIEFFEIKNIYIKVQDIEKDEYKLLIDTLGKLNNKNKFFSLTIEAILKNNVDKEVNEDLLNAEIKDINKRVEEILDIVQCVDLTLKNIPLKVEILDKVCKKSIEELFINNVILYYNVEEEKYEIKINNNIKNIEIDMLYLKKEHYNLDIKVENSKIERINFKNLEGVKVELNNLNDLGNLVVENSNKNDMDGVLELKERFHTLKNINIKTNQLLLDMELNKDLIEEITIESDNYNSLDIFDSFEEELYFKKLTKFNLLFKNNDENFEGDIPFFATGKKSLVCFSDEKGVVEFERNGQIFEISIKEENTDENEIVQDTDEENEEEIQNTDEEGKEGVQNTGEENVEQEIVQNIAEENVEQEIVQNIVEEDKKVINILGSRKMTSEEIEKCKSYANDKGINETEFLEIVKEHFAGNITKSQADIYDNLKKDSKFTERREFREEVFDFVNNLLVENKIK